MNQKSQEPFPDTSTQVTKPRKTLVIADLHNHVWWVEPALRELKKTHGYDEVVFLGDYFDDFNDGAWDAQKTAMWLKASLNQPNRIHLVGNHDMPYLIPNNESLWCPGFTHAKSRVINEELTAADKALFRPAYFSNGLLFSHAGFHPTFALNPVTLLPYTPAELIARAEKEMELLKGGLPQPLFLPGYRMGEDRIGGITWADWDSEFESVKGLTQVVGHTPAGFPRTLGNDYCLDTNNRCLMLITDGSIEILPNPELKNR